MDGERNEYHFHAPVQGMIIGENSNATFNYQGRQEISLDQQCNRDKMISNIPYHRNAFFTGRDESLKQLYDNLHKISTLTQPQAISGLGGIGKTQIALEYAYRYFSEYRAILWVRADTEDTLCSDFLVLADLLQLCERMEQDRHIIIAAVKRWLENNRDWLLILDNADDLDLAYDFLPHGKNTNGHIILTTRVHATANVASNIQIKKMAQDDGMLLLLKRARFPGSDISINEAMELDRILAKTIVEVLDGLPLALDQAGAFIEETRCSLSDYLDMYRTHRFVLLNQRGGLAADHPHSVATTFSLAFQRLLQIDPTAANLLQLCAFLHPDEIPEEIFTDYRPIAEVDPDLQPIVSDQFQLNMAIKSLLNFSLVQRNPDTKTLTIHRLVQTILKDEMDCNLQHQGAERTVRYVSRSFPHSNPGTWSACQRFLPHAYLGAELIDQWNLDLMEAAGLLYRIGQYLYDRATYQEVEMYYQKALKICEKTQGTEYPGTVIILTSLAELKEKQGVFSQAERFYQQALELRKKVFGPEDPQVANSLNDLAGLYRNQGNYTKAESYYLRALKLYKKALGTKGISKLGPILNDLALLYKAQGKYTKAESLYKQSLEIKIQQPEDIDLASNLCNLADLYKDQGRYSEAEPLSLQALMISEKIQGPEHPDVATKANNLALIYLEQGKYAETESLFLRAIAINENAFDVEHPNTAVTLNNLSTLYLRQGKYVEAEVYLKRALAINEPMLGPCHPNVATNLENLALCYYFQHRYEEAESLYKQTLAIWEQTLGKEPLKLINTLRNYAYLLFDLKRELDAIRFLRQANEIEASIKGNNQSQNKKEGKRRR